MLTKLVPVEIWDEIFSYLPHEDLLNSTLVSKSWNNLISNSTAFERKTCLGLDQLLEYFGNPKFDSYFIQQFRIERKYRWLSFSLSRELKQPHLHHHLLTQLMPTASNLYNVTFSGCEFSIGDFIHFIQQCKLLKELEVSSCRFKKTSKVIPLIELNLERFRFHESDRWILDHFDCRRVKKEICFERVISDRHGYNDSTDEIVRFLNKIEGEVGKLKLQEIDVDSTSVELQPKFKWMSLGLFAESVNTMFSDTMPNKEKLYAAASPDATTLDFCFDRGHQRLYDLIAGTKSVNKLCIGDGMFTKIQLSYDDQETLEHINDINELIFTPGIAASQDQESSSHFQPFMNKFTGLKFLRMNAVVARNFHSSIEVQPYQRNLKTIQLFLPKRFLTLTTTVDNLKKLVLPEMEKLIVTGYKKDLMHVEYAEFMSALSENSPKLQRIQIKLTEPMATQDEMHRILLNIYAATKNVSVFEIKWDVPERLFKITRAEIIMQFYGSDEAFRRTFALMQGREFRG